MQVWVKANPGITKTSHPQRRNLKANLFCSERQKMYDVALGITILMAEIPFQRQDKQRRRPRLPHP